MSDHWSDTPCDEWPKSRNKKGYGNQWHEGRCWLAHRLAWHLEVGPIPDGLLVCHRCDNPPCRNVKHLFLGTNAENNADMDAKGRRNWQPGVAKFVANRKKQTHCPKGHSYADALTSGGKRRCRTCARARWAREDARRRVAA